MLREKRRPHSHDERMIVNNYRAMQFIREIKKEKLTPSVIFQLHGILIEGTLPDGVKSGVFRRDEDNIVVHDDRDGTVLHTPPKAAELPRRMKALCDFANAEAPEGFLHPPCAPFYCILCWLTATRFLMVTDGRRGPYFIGQWRITAIG